LRKIGIVSPEFSAGATGTTMRNSFPEGWRGCIVRSV
jgi:hypothetical protein